MLKKVKVGDQIVTASGIFAKVEEIKEDRFLVSTADGSQIEIAKQSVLSIVKAS